jgi:hypothetical protein
VNRNHQISFAQIAFNQKQIGTGWGAPGKVLMDHFQEFLKVLKAMDDEGVEYILIGGFAIILHGLPRFTMDMDFFIKMASENVDRLRKALYSLFADSDIEEITFDELVKYPVIRYGTPNGFHGAIRKSWNV